MPEPTDLQVSRPVGPDLRSTAAALTFKDTAIPAPLADGWHAFRQHTDAPREPSRFALFKGGRLVATATAQPVPRRRWVWRTAMASGGEVLTAGRAEGLEEAMAAAQTSLRAHTGSVSLSRAATLRALWEGRDAGT